MTIDKQDTYTKYTSLSDTMMKYISKEGINQFPTIVFLLNRMFLSDENNIASFLNIPQKISINDNFIWYKNTYSVDSISSTLTASMKEIISGIPMLNEDTSTGKGITKIFKIDKSHMYFIKNSTLLYGTVSSFIPVKLPNGISVSDVYDIVRISDSYDLMITKYYLYTINESTGITTLRLEAGYNINEIENKDGTKTQTKEYTYTFNSAACISGSSLVVGTTHSAIVIDNFNTFTTDGFWTVARTIGKRTYNIKVSSETSSSTSYTVNNGCPINITAVCAPDNSGKVYVGTPTDGVSIYITDSGSETDYAYEYTYTGTEAKSSNDIYASTIEKQKIFYKVARVLDKQQSYITSNAVNVWHVYGTNYDFSITGCKNLDAYFIGNDWVVGADNTNKVMSFIQIENTANFINITASEGVPKSITDIFGLDRIFYVMTSDSVYKTFDNEDTYHRISMYPVGFVYATDSQTKKVDSAAFYPDFIDVITSIFSADYFNSNLKTVNNRTTGYLYVVAAKHGIHEYYTYGNDDRNRVAIEIKNISAGLGIG